MSTEENNMRVLLINDNHMPIGGAEQYFFDLKARLKKVPDMKVFSLGFGPQPYRVDDVIVFKGLRSKIAKWLWQIVFHPILYFKIRRHLKKIRPDVIHIHNIKQYSITVLAAIKSYPLVQTIHDYSAVCPTAYNIHKDNLHPCSTGFKWRCCLQHHMKYNFLVYFFLIFTFLIFKKQQKKLIKKFFAPSPLLTDYLTKNHFINATYVPPFINNHRQHSFDEIKPHHFLFVGQFGAHKGIYFLLEEFALAVMKNNRLTLTLAGTGSIENHLRQQVKKLGIAAHISFIGWQNHLEKYYQECTAVIFPSIWMEAFGLVIAEAMMHARAVIGSNRGSPLWLIDDKETGLIINPYQSGDLAEKILVLANDTALAKKLGKNGCAKIERIIDNDRTLNYIIESYQELTIKQNIDLEIRSPRK